MRDTSNHCHFAGYLPCDGERRVSGSAKLVTLCFRVMVETSAGGDPAQLMFQVVDGEIIQRCERYLTKGRYVTVHAEARLIPFHKAGGIARDYIGFHVLGLMVHDRSHPLAPVAEPVNPAEASTPADGSALKSIAENAA